MLQKILELFLCKPDGKPQDLYSPRILLDEGNEPLPIDNRQILEGRCGLLDLDCFVGRKRRIGRPAELSQRVEMLVEIHTLRRNEEIFGSFPSLSTGMGSERVR